MMNPAVHAAVREALRVLAPAWILEDFYESAKAQDQIARRPPTAVLMDIYLPRGSGIACTRGLKQCCPQLAIIMFTRLAEVTHRERHRP
jgi:DNA-binding NarL/FixJ family response regulator